MVVSLKTDGAEPGQVTAGRDMEMHATGLATACRQGDASGGDGPPAADGHRLGLAEVHADAAVAALLGLDDVGLGPPGQVFEADGGMGTKAGAGTRQARGLPVEDEAAATEVLTALFEGLQARAISHPQLDKAGLVPLLRLALRTLF